jgi:hypothetical protein
MERFESYSRLTGDEQFRHIAEENLNKFDELNITVGKLRNEVSEVLSNSKEPDNPPSEYYELHLKLNPLETERDQCCIIAIVFSAMYFEAFIYDYAASCLGDNYVKEHLDKLDFISKWLVIPKLITGKELSKKKQAYQTLKRLHKDRNSLVHLKSKQMFFEQEKMSTLVKDIEKDIQESTKNCRVALNIVVPELFAIDASHPKLRLSIQSHNKANAHGKI